MLAIPLPRNCRHLNTPGIARGVNVSGNIAVVADGSGGVRTLNVSNPASPVSLGTVATIDARDLTVEGSIAYVADFTGSLKTVDFSTPTTPQLLATTSQALGGILTDVAKVREFVFGADVFFVNGVPIVNVSDPANPVVRARLDFPARDDNGNGIAVDNQYVYLAADPSIQENGTNGNSRLYIGQYVALEDHAGVPPVVSITSPAAGATVIEGSTLQITVQATDDVQVASVDFLVNGVVVFTDSAAPYQFNLAVPTGVATVTLGATALDLGGNVGVAANRQINVIPDPLTTVTGRVVDENGQPVPGATVTTLNSFNATSGADGTFSIASVPTVQGPITVSAEVVVAGKRLTGHSAAVNPVPNGQTNVGDIVVREGGVIGYYDLDLNNGSSTQVAPIITAGLQAVNVGNLATADLSQFNVLFVQNPNNGGYSSTFTSNLARIHQFVANGGVLIFHDRHVTTAANVMPGSPGSFFRDFNDDANIDIVDNTTLVTNGPGGVITNASLDGGNSSSHGSDPGQLHPGWGSRHSEPD